MNLIFLGPPGAGKGSLAAKAVPLLGLPHISTGVIFRSAIASDSPLGLKVKAIVESGKLVDDATTSALVKDRLKAADTQSGFILDGYPRTIGQAEALADYCPIDLVINFDIPDDLVLARLSGRQVCRACGANFHKLFIKPRRDGFCDQCGGQLYIRDDDQPAAVQKRLDLYRAQTAPLIEYYRSKALLRDVDARPALDQVLLKFQALLASRTS